MGKLKLLSKKGNVADSPLRKKLKTTPLITSKKEKQHIDFISSGSWLLNLALTNNIDLAYPIGRIINAVGSYSVGKTLLVCECINAAWYEYHKKQKKKIKIYYDEPESAFDLDLAKEFQMPLTEIVGLRERLPGWKTKSNDFKPSKLIENLYTNIQNIVKNESKDHDLIIYILDSLDAVSDSRELNHVENKGIESQDYGGGKAKVLSQLFRTSVQAIDDSNIILYILSQVRASYAKFGPKYTRSGGNALNHYATQIIWLKETGKIKSDKGVIQGIEVECNIDKNKIGSRYNKVNFNILFGYGIDNYSSAIDFLWNTNGFEKSGNRVVWGGKNLYRKALLDLIIEDKSERMKLKNMVQQHWHTIIDEAAIKRKPKWAE